MKDNYLPSSRGKRTVSYFDPPAAPGDSRKGQMAVLDDDKESMVWVLSEYVDCSKVTAVYAISSEYGKWFAHRYDNGIPCSGFFENPNEAAKCAAKEMKLTLKEAQKVWKSMGLYRETPSGTFYTTAIRSKNHKETVREEKREHFEQHQEKLKQAMKDSEVKRSPDVSFEDVFDAEKLSKHFNL